MSTFYDQGRYECEITQQAMTKASTGTVQFVLRFRVLRFVLANGEMENVRQQYERTSYRAITENTMKYVERDLEALGFTGNSLRDLDPVNRTHESFVGKVLDFNCGHDKDLKGDLREKWSVAWAEQESSAIEGSPVEPAAYRQLDALFSRNKGGGPSQQRQQQEQPQQRQRPVAEHRPITDSDPISDDDIPF
jgi:hypothetical protein